MTFLGESISDEESALGPRRNKDLMEEMMFQRNKDLFSELDLVFFDTTSIFLRVRVERFLVTGAFSKDHRPDLHQMVVGAVLDDNGRPICCEMWPGNTTDVKTMIPIVDRLRHRFGIGQFCIVADRGMISSDTISKLEARQMPYILGTRMRRVKEVKAKILTRAGRYKEVHPENADRSKPSHLKIKEFIHNDTRYIICLNERQARKDAADRQAIISSLKKQLKKGPKALVGNKGYRKYLKVQKTVLR